jgi:glycosyltransferase involved in cell wall biosynthesis
MKEVISHPHSIAVVYASDFERLSLGGIKNYIESMGRTHPKNLAVTYIHIGKRRPKFLPPEDASIGLDVGKSFSSLNANFIKRILWLDMTKYDLVICHRAEMALFLKIFKRVKYVLVLHGGTMNALRGTRKFFGILYPFIEILAVALSRYTMSVNPSATFSTKFIGNRVKQAPLTFNHKVFNLVSRNSDASDYFLVGRLEPEKRFDLALELIAESFKISSKRRLIHIIGEGSMRRQLEEIATSLGLDVVFHGFCKPNEVASLLKSKGAVLLLTSRYEGAPLVALEALACGLRVIALRGPGLDKNLEHLGCEVFASKTEFIKNLLKDQIDFHQMPASALLVENIAESSLEVFWSKVDSALSRN